MSDLEGVYTGRFTYRTDEPIPVHGALADERQTQVEVWMRAPSEHLVATFPANLGAAPQRERPGESGAGFPIALEIPAQTSAGIYEVRIPQDVMRVENRMNDQFNAFPSDNSVARFVVTPALRGSSSRILWVHDSLTATAYGSFGGQSIYGWNGIKDRVVSLARPGLDRATSHFHTIRVLERHGFDFEYTDLVELSDAPPGFLDPYDVVVMVGQFEYVPHVAMAHLAAHLFEGGKLFVAANEFAIQRVRVDVERAQMSAYKWDFAWADPLSGTGSPEVAGVGMNIPETYFESEIIGQTLWASHKVSVGTTVDLEVAALGEASWILDGTGLRRGDFLRGAFSTFGTGNLVSFDDAGEPFIVDHELTRTPEETQIWAGAPSPDGLEWWNAQGRHVSEWPRFAGYTCASYQQRQSGAEVVTFPSHHMAKWTLGDPVFERILLNVMSRLSNTPISG